MAIKKKYAALGRGLDALISTEKVNTAGSGSINEIPVGQIFPNPNQPRREFDPVALRELSDSIRELGIVQPITLRDQGDGTYLIIAGERRWRASQMAGLESIPAYVRTVDDENMMEMALIENIQREDLNPLEIALAYQQLIEQHNLSQEQLSKRVGKGRATIANFLRLLKLPGNIQVALKEKQIDMGHAKALLSLPSHADQIRIFNEIIKNGYSVRDVEELVRNVKEENTPATKANNGKKQDDAYHQLKKHLTHFFQTPVQLTCSEKGNGKISIKFKNEQELERIIAIFDKLNQ